MFVLVEGVVVPRLRKNIRLIIFISCSSEVMGNGIREDRYKYSKCTWKYRRYDDRVYIHEYAGK